MEQIIVEEVKLYVDELRKQKEIEIQNINKKYNIEIQDLKKLHENIIHKLKIDYTQEKEQLLKQLQEQQNINTHLNSMLSESKVIISRLRGELSLIYARNSNTENNIINNLKSIDNNNISSPIELTKHFNE